MKTSQILVRTIPIRDLKASEHSGIKHGKFMLVSPAEVSAEIERRINNSRR